jgi:tetratricopeptide (TPR) repeat protein
MKKNLTFLWALWALTLFNTRAAQVSEEAKKHMAYGAEALEMATDDEGFKKAAAEFLTAANLAPKWPSPYYNLGVVDFKLGDLEGARVNYEKYLKLAPHAKDAEKVKAEIYKIEYKKKQQSDLGEFYGEYFQACNEGFAHQDTLYLDQNGSGGYYMLIINNTDGSRLWNENLLFDRDDKGIPDSFKTYFHYSPDSTMSSGAPLKMVFGTLSRRGGPTYMAQEKGKSFITVGSDARGPRDNFCSMVFLLENKSWRWNGNPSPAP